MERNEQKKALEAMLNDRLEGGMSVEQLKILMETELNKDAKDIDTAYIDELTMLILELQAEGQPTVRKTKRSGSHRCAKRMMRIAAVILVMVTAIGGAACAFQWIDIGRFFTPLMEQFGIHINYEENEETPVEIYKCPLQYPERPLTIEPNEIVDLRIDTEGELPTSINDCPVIQPKLPDGYEFEYGKLYSDDAAIIFTRSYVNGQNYLVILWCLNKESVGNAVWITENNSKFPLSNEIPIYEDYDRWIAFIPLEAEHYLIWGNASKNEIQTVAEGIRGAIK